MSAWPSNKANAETEAAHLQVVPYNAQWPSAFATEREVLARVLLPWLAGTIEHVGSTAVPGLCAKPVIDIMAGTHSLDHSRAAITPLVEVGYVYYPHRPDVMHWFCKPCPDRRTHHLHLVPYRSQLWDDRLAFRDRLRADGGLADEYAALKRSLVETHPTDREAYTAAKAPFVKRVLERGSLENDR